MANTPTIQVDQLSDAIITAPGELIQILDTALSSDSTSSATFVAVSSAETSVSFVAPYAATYEFSASLELWSTSGTSTGRYRLVIDAGEAEEQSSPDEQQYDIRTDSTRSYKTVSWQCELTAGSHTFDLQWRVSDGAGVAVGSSSSAQVTARSITGSGAGGEIVAERVMDQNDVLTTTAAWEVIQDSAGDVSFTLTTNENDWVNIVGKFQWTVGSAGTVRFGIGVDGADPIDKNSNAIRTEVIGGNNAIYPAWKIQPGAGSHVFRLCGYRDTALTYTIRGGVSDAATALWASIQRGGLVPVLKDGVLVQDKPTGVNYVGANTTVTDVGGQVNVEFNGVADGVDPTTFTMGADFVTSSATYVAVTDSSQSGADFAVTAEVEEGESVVLSGKLAMLAVGGAVGCSVGLGVDGEDPTGAYVITASINTGYHVPIPISFIYGPLSAGTHTFRIMAKRLSGTVNLEVRGTGGAISTLQVSRILGGYVQPENIPILEYSSASAVSVAAAPGAASTLRVLLNDGQRYTATSPLIIDLTVSGRGGLDTGSEAVSTWYYCYLVPDAAGTALSAVCSATDPDTGPTGFDAWRYIGAIRNDGSGDIKNFAQYADEFTLLDPENSDAEIYALSNGSPATGSWTNIPIGAAIPSAVASHIRLDGWQDTDAGGIHRVWINPGNPPGFTPTSGNPGGSFLSTQENTSITNSKWEVIPDGTLSHYWTDSTGAVDVDVRATAWRDKYLTANREARAQAAPTQSNLWRYLDATNLPTGAAAPEAVWQFDGTASELDDRTANGHDLTVSVGTLKHSSVNGLFGLSSIDDYVLTAASPSGLRTLGAVTVDMLVSFFFGQQSQIAWVGALTESEADNILYSFYVLTSSHLHALHEYGAGDNEAHTFDGYPAFGPLQHVAFTRSSDGLTYKVYLDGQLIDTQVASNAPTGGSNGSFVLLGVTGAPDFAGVMCSCRVTKEEWSAAQVLESYQYCRKLI